MMRSQKDKGAVTTEVRTCPCGSEFEATLVVYGTGKAYGGLKFCDDCQEKWEAEEARQLAIQERRRLEAHRFDREMALIKAAGFPPRFLNKGWVDDEEVPWLGYDKSRNAKGFQKAIAWLRLWGKHGGGSLPSLIIQGGYGSGKTYLAVAIGVALCRKWAVTDRFYRTDNGVLFTTASGFGVRMRATYRRDSSESEENVYDAIEQARLIILDDVGDPTKEKDSDATRRQYFEIINRRYNADKPVLLTLNFRLGKDDAALAEFFSPAVYSRLVEMCKGRVIDLGEIDRRRS